ncbi:hypothetical protein NKDENANG_01997 [Candidatus Entotheonellaceae bacterium PAL068K]
MRSRTCYTQWPSLTCLPENGPYSMPQCRTRTGRLSVFVFPGKLEILGWPRVGPGLPLDATGSFTPSMSGEEWCTCIGPRVIGIRTALAGSPGDLMQKSGGPICGGVRSRYDGVCSCFSASCRHLCRSLCRYLRLYPSQEASLSFPWTYPPLPRRACSTTNAALWSCHIRLNGLPWSAFR